MQTGEDGISVDGGIEDILGVGGLVEFQGFCLRGWLLFFEIMLQGLDVLGYQLFSEL
jgi:hypothetical protein